MSDKIKFCDNCIYENQTPVVAPCYDYNQCSQNNYYLYLPRKEYSIKNLTYKVLQKIYYRMRRK